jgi:hypothetical protein
MSMAADYFHVRKGFNKSTLVDNRPVWQHDDVISTANRADDVGENALTAVTAVLMCNVLCSVVSRSNSLETFKL